MSTWTARSLLANFAAHQSHRHTVLASLKEKNEAGCQPQARASPSAPVVRHRSGTERPSMALLENFRVSVGPSCGSSSPSTNARTQGKKAGAGVGTCGRYRERASSEHMSKKGEGGKEGASRASLASSLSSPNPICAHSSCATVSPSPIQKKSRRRKPAQPARRTLQGPEASLLPQLQMRHWPPDGHLARVGRHIFAALYLKPATERMRRWQHAVRAFHSPLPPLHGRVRNGLPALAFSFFFPRPPHPIIPNRLRDNGAIGSPRPDPSRRHPCGRFARVS